ncbi:tripartite tricarboxylate transporter TctB family protein [Arsenicitalea aurantiaca]|uniref:Tripartite tricarboxylate transporter TctB family protein n=1 Tax=Arsenicitalea aurantiaca TaxID=1783274 RepID=A0A433X7M0_9HYPH|nr:tripartite tricarboxylate transporter TctB family protein [Arsenicitalea aurantiaca]RUT30052.1 tripartite tricarboxylate transporter TctB family protein [Arsenicitalea aurantiaca]
MDDREAGPAGPDMVGQDAEDGARMVRADLLAGLFFVVLGVAILYASWTMPRLEARRIHPMTIPGLVPGLLSVALVICGGVLAFRSSRAHAPGGWRALGSIFTSEAALRAGAVAGLALIYTLGLVGLVPFWAATAIFVAAFILVFEVWLAEPRRPLLESLPWAVGLAIVTAIVVTLVFERAFLVRLP